jgi:hypothetical protein
VGSYQHLRDGSGDKLDDDMGLGQLTSPPMSAMAVAKFFLEEYEISGNEATLGSVEMVLSPSQKFKFSRSGSKLVKAATLENITSSFDRWYERCNCHERNIAIFYFCGHGIQRGNLLLPAEDFGKTRHRPFEHAIEFDETWRGMSSCAASIQCFFPDTCREVKRQALSELGSGTAKALAAANAYKQGHRDALVVYATGFGQQAFGMPDRASNYSEALLLALRGRAGKRDSGRWVITTCSLGDGMLAGMQHLSQRPEVPEQQLRVGGEAAGGVLRVLTDPPVLPATVSCVPLAANRVASLNVSSIVGRQQQWTRTPAPEPWHLELPAAVYQAEATFTTTDYKGDPAVFYVDPPDPARAELKVSP